MVAGTALGDRPPQRPRGQLRSGTTDSLSDRSRGSVSPWVAVGCLRHRSPPQGVLAKAGSRVTFRPTPDPSAIHSSTNRLLLRTSLRSVIGPRSSELFFGCFCLRAQCCGNTFDADSTRASSAGCEPPSPALRLKTTGTIWRVRNGREHPDRRVFSAAAHFYTQATAGSGWACRRSASD